MEIVIGVVFWGGVFVALAAWLTRPPRAAGSARRPTAASGPVAAARPAPQGDTPREAEALTDGLIIGHLLTRDHYRPRLDELEDRLEAAARDRDAAFLEGDPDLDVEDGHDDPIALDPFVDDPFVDDPFDDDPFDDDPFDVRGEGMDDEMDDVD